MKMDFEKEAYGAGDKVIASFCARKIPKTAPYAPEVRDLGPYTLNNLKEITGSL